MSEAHKGKSFSEEHRKRLGEVRKGQILTKETKQKIGKANKGRKPTEEARQKMSEAHKGKKFSLETRKKMSRVRKERIFSEEWRKKLSESKKGEKNYSWKGGITPENKRIRFSIEFRLWREAVFARDNWTCQSCEKRGGELHPHHIMPFAKYPELRFAIDNGITFCKECHKKTHKKN